MENETESTKPGLFTYKGFNFISNVHEEGYVDTLEQFVIRDDDIFVVTYPKSGTTWMQYILTLLCHNEDLKEETHKRMIDVVPWFEVKQRTDLNEMPSPRTFLTHLPTSLVPQGLRHRGKVIYVVRNPKDVAISYFHFHNIVKLLPDQKNLDQFLDDFLEGKVFAGSWFAHINDWYNHKDEFNLLFLTFEEMKKDRRGAIMKISNFLGKTLDSKTLDTIVEKISFENMKKNPTTCAEKNFPKHFDSSKGSMLRKGQVGDWKTVFTMEQNERFDRIYQEKMSKLPLEFIWDL
ncbi:amine sulfotransferase-like [Megalops cyprinoides]|uniref:amine sulfotransferase-like n=1 Tax=Megalops cyprinoides TaxID=118141 RepID=UPI0018655AE3|nr:amine sulfotransferase-like [Megalops cyprinoides]